MPSNTPQPTSQSLGTTPVTVPGLTAATTTSTIIAVDTTPTPGRHAEPEGGVANVCQQLQHLDIALLGDGLSNSSPSNTYNNNKACSKPEHIVIYV